MIKLLKIEKGIVFYTASNYARRVVSISQLIKEKSFDLNRLNAYKKVDYRDLYENLKNHYPDFLL